MIGKCISVAMATYNGVRYLAEQLDSILTQSRVPDEMVICDDGSSDGTWALLNEYQRRYPLMIRLFRNDATLGPAKNFEKAISLCTGNLIALSDQDDIWHADKLQKLAEAFESDPGLGLIFSNAAQIDEVGSELDKNLWQVAGFHKGLRDKVCEGRALPAFLKKPVVTGCTMMFRADLRSLCLPVGQPLMHDHWISLVAAASSRVTFVNEKLVDYRQHQTNQIGARELSLRQRFDRAYRLGVLQCAQEKAGLEKLIERLEDAEQQQLSLIRQKIDFLEFRLWLWSDEAPRFRRACSLVREAVRGEYGRWGNGLRAVGKDAVMLLKNNKTPMSGDIVDGQDVKR